MAAIRLFRSCLSSRFSRSAIRMQLRELLRGAAVLGIGVGLLSQTSFAQFGGIGQTGGGQLGGFGQMGGMGQLGGMGQTGMGQMGMGQAGMGQLGGMGQMGGMGQTGGMGQAGANGAAANPFGSGGMLGSANSFGGLAGAALMNRSLQGGMGGIGGMGMGMQGMGGMGGMGGRNNRGGMNQNQNQNSNKPKIRATVKLGFEIEALPNAEKTRLVNERISRTPSAALEGVTVVMQGRTAVIRGEVDSPAAGKVVERYLSLEPGIDAVKNELTFANGASNASTPRAAGSSAVPPIPRPPVTNSIPPTSSAPGSSAAGANAEIVPPPGPSL